MNWISALGRLLDPYELRARLFPGLLVLSPAIAFLALLYGNKNPLIVALSTVMATCGGPYLLSSFVRSWGQRAQDRLHREWGAQPSTILLRHRDNQLPRLTKLRYHELVASQLALIVPSADEERQDPVHADQVYASASDALRPLTSDSRAFPFIFKELVAYGYNRNAYGSRWVGFGVALATIVATLLHAGALRLEQPLFTQSGLDAAHILVLLVAACLAVLWCAHFTAETVKLAGFSYAKRLWEALEKVPKRGTRVQRKRGGKASEGAPVVEQ